MLERALLASAAAGGCQVAIEDLKWRRWASVTFTGARHCVTLVCTPAPALERWLAALPEAELVLRGHLVADLVVTQMHRRGNAATVELEVLTVEER